MGEIGIFIITLIVLFLLGIVVIFNNCISLRNKIKQSKSTIDIYLTQRFDLIPNLVECVKSYKNYEAQTLENIIKLRSSYNETKDILVASNLYNQVNDIMARGEATPNLKSSEQFLMLQKSIFKIENQLQAARRIYNGDVTLYNTAIQKFPNNIVANIMKFETVDLLEIDEYKTENLEVKI